jgi:predicted nucleotidyltransferase
MKEITNYAGRITEYFKSEFGLSLVEVYTLGSLSHGGFSQIYSDIDVGVILNCPNPPNDIERIIAEAKGLDEEYGKKLSVFWGNPEYDWGRLPVLDRLDLLDHGVAMLNNIKPAFPRPSKDAIHHALRESLDKSYVPKCDELNRLIALEPKDRKPYIRCILYPARFIYTWDCLEVNSNDRAVEYLRSNRPAGLDLRPIEMALACRRGECTAEDVFGMNTDLNRQFEKTLSYISTQ